jgi:LuxR family maltose regulon positive regulatory protein
LPIRKPTGKENRLSFTVDTGESEHIAMAQSFQAQLSLLQGDSKPAIAWADSYDVKTHTPNMLVWLEIPLITKLRIMVATGSRERLQQAGELLVTLCQSAEALHNTYHIIEIRILQCVALVKQGHTDEALKTLQQAIELAEPGGWVYPFVQSGPLMAKLLEQLADQQGATDYLRLLLDKFPADERQQPDAAAGESRAITGSEARLEDSLTRREFDVLELLAQRLQTKEIAARLFVSSETVKSHLKHLYQKLDVYNRRDAAIKAEELLSRRRDAS